MLRLKLLGGFDARCDDTPLPRLQQERLQSLLACLLLSPNGAIPRRELAYRFWPDTTDAQARTNLRTLLTRLRDALPEPDRYLALDALTAGVRADAPIESDVAAFESALRQAVAARQENRAGAAIEALQAAVAAYGGDLLPGCYDEWIVPERERLRQAYHGALEGLIELLRSRGDYRAAIEQTRRPLRADPLHEPAYRELMRLHMAMGDRAGALRAYHACAATLRDELGADPAPETDALHLEVLRQEGTPAPAATSAAPVQPDLIGPDAPWTALTAAWRRAAQGKPQFALLSGEAGIGKTRLAEDLIAWIERQEQPVAVARCYAGQTDVPYAPIVQWLAAPAIRQRLDEIEAPWLVEVSRLATWLQVERPDLPAPGPLTEAWQRQRLFEALARALSGPGAFFVDDLQWCDGDTLDWLGYWLRSKLHAPFMLVSTARAEEMNEGYPLTDLRLSLAQAGLGTEVPLKRLDLRQTAAVGATLLGRALSDAEAERLYRDAEGVPLFIVEIARAGLAEGASIARPGAMPDPDDSTLPPVMRAVIEFRLSRLSPAEREAAHTAAVIGREFNADVLALAMGKTQDDLVAALDELWQRQIIREQGADAYDFSHDKIRQVAYAGLSSIRRRRLHRSVALALGNVHAQNLDAVSALIAGHFERALESVEAYRWHLRAGKAAQYTNASETAIWHFRKALSLLPPNVGLGEQIEIYERMGATMHSRAQFMEAQRAYQEMRRIAELAGDPAAQARAWRHMAQVQDSNADHWRSLESARMVEHLAGSVGVGSQAERATSLFMQGLAYYRLGRAEDAIRLGEAALAISSALGAAGHRQMARSLNLLGAIHTMLGDHDRARAEREQALDLFRELGDLVWIGHCLNNLGEIARHRGDYTEALPLYQEALAIAEQIGNREGEAVYRCNLGGVLVRLGQHESAIAELRKALAVSDTGYWVSEAYCSLAEALLCQEQVGESLQAGQEALRIGRQANAMRAMGIAWRVIGMIIARCGETVVIDGVARTPTECFSESDRVLAAIGAETERQRTSLEWTNYSKKSPSP